LKGIEPHLTVPACEPCNATTKLDDEYLLQFMSGGSHTEESVAVWAKKVVAKFADFPATQAGLRDQLDHIPVSIPELGRVPVPVIKASTVRLQRVVRKLVFGLHWFHTGRLLDPSTPIEYFGLNLFQLEAFMKSPDSMAVFERAAVGIYRDAQVIRTFFYKVGFADGLSIWYFIFFGNNMVVAVAGDQNRAAG
jgi:hypothetical protein